MRYGGSVRKKADNRRYIRRRMAYRIVIGLFSVWAALLLPGCGDRPEMVPQVSMEAIEEALEERGDEAGGGTVQELSEEEGKEEEVPGTEEVLKGPEVKTPPEGWELSLASED